MFCTNCGKKLAVGEKFCTRCGHKAPVPVESPSEAMQAQEELQKARTMLSEVKLPDLNAVYAHLGKAAKCKDQALLQQVKALADKYADIARCCQRLSRPAAQPAAPMPAAQPSPHAMPAAQPSCTMPTGQPSPQGNPYLKAAAAGAVGAGIGTMAAGAMNGNIGATTAEAASSAGSSFLTPNVGAQLADHFVRDNHDTLSDAASDIADTASDVADAATDTLGDVVDFLSDLL